MTALRLHNSLSGRVEKFAPAAPVVTMYVCGPTVYGPVHVGNARPLVVFDVLYRLLRRRYGRVKYARNITDIDDKIIAAAKQEGAGVKDVADKYAARFASCARALGSLKPTFEPKATDNIAAMIALAAKLVAKDHAYEAQGHVLFAVDTFADYGRLSNRSPAQMVAGARVEVAPYKRSPADFVLWKPSSPEQPGWDSPWGRGRPGWHLECSAMIEACLGPTIDIHGGGRDLEFPHHENEIAQSCCALGVPRLANYWMHNGHVTSAGSKMSKSVGNIFGLEEALAQYPGEAIRYALLSAHYRQPLEFSAEVLAAARTALDRLYRALENGGSDVRPELVAAGDEPLLNDLNTPQALAQLHEHARAANSLTGRAAAAAQARLRGAGAALGLLEQDPHAWLGDLSGAQATEEWINAAVKQRQRARAEADYATADRLRAQLAAAGVVLEDKADQTLWRRK